MRPAPRPHLPVSESGPPGRKDDRDTGPAKRPRARGPGPFVSIIPDPQALPSPHRGWRHLAWRLQFHLLRVLETVLRTAVFGRQAGATADRAAVDRPMVSEDGEEVWRRQLSVGHGCPGPDLATSAINAIDTGLDQAAEPRVAVWVVGDGECAAELIGRLATLDVQVHATAETIDDAVLLRNAGAFPHRVEDMPAIASRIDLLISTSLSRYVSAQIVARLPESSVIIDLAGPPGSVDFETSRRLDRKPIWAASCAAGHFEDFWTTIRAHIDAIASNKA